MDTESGPEIESMSYDEQTQDLRIQYRGHNGWTGWNTLYQGVPAHLYEGLKQSASPAGYLKSEIEGAGYNGISCMTSKRLMSKAEARHDLKNRE